MSADGATYLDASAIVKLVIREVASDALRQAVGDWNQLVSSAIAQTEVRRALLRAGVRDDGRSTEVLQGIGLLRVSDDVLLRAGTIGPPTLRSLDAIHLASAASLGVDLQGFCTYDVRQASAAEAAGMVVIAPS